MIARKVTLTERTCFYDPDVRRASVVIGGFATALRARRSSASTTWTTAPPEAQHLADPLVDLTLGFVSVAFRWHSAAVSLRDFTVVLLRTADGAGVRRTK
jgi:hypothetical protein